MNYQYAVVGSTGAVVYTITDGFLPTGWSMSSSGLVTGVATVSGEYAWRVHAVDSIGKVDNLQDTAYILDLEGTPPNGILNTPYTYVLKGVHGIGPYTFTRTAGTLPNGLTLATNGTLSGTPTVQATFTFTVQVVDANGILKAYSYSMTILAAGGGGLKLPNYNTGSYNVTRVGAHDVACGIEFLIKSDGTYLVHKSLGPTAAVGTQPLTGTWHTAPAAGVGTGYEVRLYGTVYDSTTGSTDPFDTGFETLATDRNIDQRVFATTGSPGPADHTVIYTLTTSYRVIGELTVLDSTITLEAEASV